MDNNIKSLYIGIEELVKKEENSSDNSATEVEGYIFLIIV